MSRALLFLAGLAACHAPAPRAVREDAVPTAAASLVHRGMALGTWDFAGRRDAYAGELAEIAGLGTTHVLLSVSWRQRDVHAEVLAADAAVTMPDEQLTAVLRQAHASGLGVLLFPIVDLAEIRTGQWRGTIAPPDVDAWWRSYRAFVLHYARIAAREQVAAFSLGSELGSTEAWRDRWYALASEVRAVFPGTLVYSANWDHYDQVSFWERVDAVGVSSYAPLARTSDASQAEMAAAWRAQRDRLVDFARRQGKPLWLTEVGCPSRDGAAMAPWDYVRPAPVDLEEQRRVFASFARAFADSELAGMFIWNWWGPGGAGDDGYTPRGKPAAGVIRAFFAR